MKKINTLLTFLLLVTNINSQNIKRGYKQLEKSDFAKAKEFFDAEYKLNSESPAANFGKTVVHADDRSPFYNLIEAWSYSLVAEKNINNLSEEENTTIAGYFANTEVRRSNWPVNKKMMQAIGTIEARLIKHIREENNLELANIIIEKFPDFRYYRNVIHIRNQLEFRKYEKQNNLEGYLEFMKKYPDAAQLEKAVKYRNLLAFEKAGIINTVEAYEEYMKNYPGAYNYGDALKLRNAAAFRLAKQKNTIESFELFIKKYPDALEIADAKKIQQQLLYEYARKIKTLEAYDEFIARYPDGSQYIDIFNLKSLDLGMKFFNASGLTWNNVTWTRSFDNNKSSEYAGDIVHTASNQYIVAGNTMQADSLFRDAWILKLDENGKMIWNKILGGRFNDSVFSVLLNSNFDIFVLGYTWLTTDSTSKEAWIFKLDSDGKKLWNRSLGKWIISSAVINSGNNLFIGGYRVNDSLEHRYSIMVINDSGKKLWERTYTSTGEVNCMLAGRDDNILIGGTNWMFKMNPKGYIDWETPVGIYGNIQSMQSLSDGSILLCGLRDSTSVLLIKVDDKGKKLWEKHFENQGYTGIKSLQILNSTTFLAVAQSEYHQELLLFNNSGNELVRYPLPYNVSIQQVILDNNGNLIFQLTEKNNITVIKNSGTNL